jgi:diguanylate cyclase (GGDEF)-like protein/PAS domain S-box-containing protein
LAKNASTKSEATSSPVNTISTLDQSLKVIKDPIQRLKKLYQLSMTLSGDPVDIFKHVAFMIGEMFDVRVVCLSEIRNDELFFISVYVDGEVTADVGQCALDVTPCATVETTKDIRIYDEVIEKFPNAEFLKTHEAHSYCGFPALDSNGDVIAVTCLLDDRAHDFSEDDQNILRIFGQRIGFEIERQRELNRRKKAVEAMRESENRFRNIVELSNAIPWEFDVSKKQYVYVGPQTEKILGYSPSNWFKDKFLQEHMHPDDRKLAEEFYDTAFSQKQDGEFEYRLIDSNDKTIWVRDSVTVITLKDGATRAQGYMFDITRQKQAEVRVQELVNLDVLTNLPNRSLLVDRLQQAINLSIRHKYFCALLQVDLDRFKIVNDSLGHTAGDALLQELAARLQNKTRASDTVARLGGDEFMILLNDISASKEQAAIHARHYAQNILEEIKRPYYINSHELHITACIGITIFPDENDTTGDLLRHANTALTKAKTTEQDNIQFFLPSMQAAAMERINLERELHSALKLKQMFLHYQPIVDVQNEKMIGLEALLRWQRADGSLVDPSIFIPIAEETGEIFTIGYWVMHEAALQFITWESMGVDVSDLFLSVNVSPRQFHQFDFIEKVKQVITETGLSPHRLKLEITEGMILSNIDNTSKKIEALKSLGITFAVDDFGTGYSSLSYLKKLPLDSLKIDKSFVIDIDKNPNDKVIVETILSMANHLELDVIAEGVENESTLHFLKQNRCHSYQGYYFSRPLPAEELQSLLRSEI